MLGFRAVNLRALEASEGCGGSICSLFLGRSTWLRSIWPSKLSVSAAFSPTEWSAWLIVSIYTLYALVGGCFTTWTFKIARDSCSDPDEACEASRTMVLSQNAGLSLAGLFNCAFALSYGSAR